MEDFSKYADAFLSQQFLPDKVQDHLAVGTAFRGMEIFISFVRGLRQEGNHVPYLSLDSLKEVLSVLKDSGKMVLRRQQGLQSNMAFEDLKNMNKKNLLTVLKGQSELELSLLKDSFRKTRSLSLVSNRTMYDMSKGYQKMNRTVTELQKKVSDLTHKAESLADDFKAAVRQREAEAYAEAATAAISSIFSIFSGGFDPNKAIKAINKARKLARSMRSIAKISQKISSLVQKLKNLGKKILGVMKNFKSLFVNFFKGAWEKVKHFWNNGMKKLPKEKKKEIIEKTKDIYDKSQDLTGFVESLILLRRSINVVKLGFDPGEEAKVKQLSEKLSVLDVLKWDLARDHVTGMMDASLSIEVPETLNYKTALLKVLRAGKAETQARIDLAKTGSDFSAAQYSFKVYVDELADITESMKDVKKRREKLESQLKEDEDEIKRVLMKKRLDAEWQMLFEKFQIKIDLYMHTVEFCKSYLYFHLQPCPPELQFNLDDSLEMAIKVANRLQFQSVQQLKNLYPPPQTFSNKSFHFGIPAKCECLDVFDKITVINNKNHNKMVNNAYAESARCLGMKNIQSDISDEIKRKIFYRSEECKLSLVTTMKQDNIITFDIPLNSTLFEYRDRVRVDEVEVYLKGAKTETGKLEIWIETAGLSQDRYRGHIYSFTGEKWIRVFSYYSPSVVASTALARKDRSLQGFNTAPDSWTTKRGMETLVMQKLEKIENRLVAIEQMVTTNNRELLAIKKIVNANSENDQSVLESADVHKSFQGIYRVPTPFTTWIVSIPRDRNPGLDLSALYEIQVRFTGSFVAVPYKADRV